MFSSNMTRHHNLAEVLLGRNPVVNIGRHRGGLLSGHVVLVLETQVVLPDDMVTVVDGNGTDIRHSLDLGRTVK